MSEEKMLPEKKQKKFQVGEDETLTRSNVLIQSRYHATLLESQIMTLALAKIQHGSGNLTVSFTDRDKSNLVMDAIYRAKEFGHLIEMDNFMKEVVYGYSKGDRNISYNISRINFVSETSIDRSAGERFCKREMSKMSRTSKDNDDLER